MKLMYFVNSEISDVSASLKAYSEIEFSDSSPRFASKLFLANKAEAIESFGESQSSRPEFRCEECADGQQYDVIGYYRFAQALRFFLRILGGFKRGVANIPG